RHPPARAVSSRDRRRIIEFSRSRSRDDDRAMAQSARVAGFPAQPEPVPLSRFTAAPDLRAAIGLWAAWLEGERRASPHTVAAYGRDLLFFLDFLAVHLGEPPGL